MFFREKIIKSPIAWDFRWKISKKKQFCLQNQPTIMAAKKKSQNRAQYERRSQRKRVLHWWLLLLILKYKRKNKIFLQISLLWCSWFRKIERIWNKEIPQRGGFCIGGKYRLPGIRGSFFEKNIIKKDGWPKCPPHEKRIY